MKDVGYLLLVGFLFALLLAAIREIRVGCATAYLLADSASDSAYVSQRDDYCRSLLDTNRLPHAHGPGK